MPHEDEHDFTGKTVVVTGGASGVGEATTLLFARQGASVIIGDIDAQRAQALIEHPENAGLAITFLPLDLRSPEKIAGFAAAVRARTQRVDVLTHVAGWDKSQPFHTSARDMNEQVMAINLSGPIELTRLLLPAMQEVPGGRIVTVASDAGRVGSAGNAVYSAAKGGLIAFTKALARETATSGINVNCVSLGPTDTPFFWDTPEKLRLAIARAIPMRRIGTAEEAAQAIVFFSSPKASYITGQVLSVNGGLNMVG